MNDFKFKKKFGQNFLVDTNIVKKIVSDINVKPNSLVIEIGCGDGKLTEFLCQKFDRVLGYEIDLDVKDRLLSNLECYNNVDIIFKDFLECDVIENLKNYSYDSLYVIANLPYYITTPIIEKLIELDFSFELVRIMVQKEVGDRFCAKVGSKDYGSFTVFLNYNFDVKKNFIVSRNSFYPRPNVDSMIVSLMSKDKIVVKNREYFYNLVYDSFKFKRKTIRNNLKGYDLNTIANVLSRHGFDLTVRAENLSVDIFCEIANELCI